MTKKEFVEKIYDDLNKKHKQETIREVFDAVFSGIEDVLETGEDMCVYGFGTFYTVYYPPRPAKNPRTGESIMSKGNTKVKFRPSSTLLQ